MDHSRDNNKPTPESRPQKGGTVTGRAVVIGVVLSICHTCWIVYEETVFGHFSISFTSFMIVHSIVALMFFLTIINSVLKRVKPSWRLAPHEMMVIYSMTTVAAVISGFDLLQNMIPVLLWPYYYGTSADGFDKLFAYVPKHFIPRDPAVVKEFFVGSNNFGRFFEPEVFKAWIAPMSFWASFLFIIGFTMFCLNSIFRRQWVDREKLNFPIIEIPLTLARENTSGYFLKNPLFLAGFGITAAILSMNALSSLYPTIPGIRLNITNLTSRSITAPPWNAVNPVFGAFWPYAIGLCYLIPLDVSFSCWFFYVFLRLSQVFAAAAGWREPNAGFGMSFPYYQSLTSGAWLAMFGVVMWNARDHIKQVLKAAVRGDKMEGDDQEPLPYAVAARLAILGFAVLVAITILAGVRPIIALAFFTVYFMATIVMTRIFSQVAMPLFELGYLNTANVILNFTGGQALTPRDATILGHFHWFNRCYRQHPMGHEMESLYFAEQTGRKMSQMTWVIIAALIIGIGVGMLTTLQIYYHRGAASAKVEGWQVNVGAEAWSIIRNWSQDSRPPAIQAVGASLVSMGIVAGLAVLRNSWFGFPLHPVGYVLACSYAMDYTWAIVFVTWFIKLLVVKYGGLKLYRKSLPFFFGITIADAVCQVVWGLIMGALHQKGLSPYLDMRWY